MFIETVKGTGKGTGLGRNQFDSRVFTYQMRLYAL